MIWKDFFYFTKTERQGILVLVVLVTGVFVFPTLREACSTPPTVSAEEEQRFRQEYDAFIASIEETKPAARFTESTTRTHSPRKIRLAPFDPNTADSVTFLSLGLPPWMAGNILRYRDKQGVFRRPEDFRKIYGLTDEQYQTLLPYIRITTRTMERDTVRLLTEQRQSQDTVFKYQPGTLVSLNEADTTELKKIPGIGSAIARMIVNHRQRLGGYCRIEQLQEIHLKAELLRPWFSIDTLHIQRVNINRAGVERMMRHPYINYYQARVIYEHRKKKGALKTLKQLSLYEEFTADDLERLEPYVRFD